MDPRFPVTRDELYNLQMDVKQVQHVQNSHAERIARLERRQADDAAIKSAWHSPFPGVLAGTPQHGPIPMPSADIFSDIDEQGLLSSLHLGPALGAAEEEPIRRGAASRANSVRFDESALHGSNWGGQSTRHSGEFCPVRPGSGLLMERSLSHKSDGRHSSAGHSVHSLHSAPSGRASSLGIETNFAGQVDDSPIDIPEPPPVFFALGSVPSIIRCWLTTNFAHETLLYADVCTGSQKSTLEYSLVKELNLLSSVERDSDGSPKLTLPVYLAEGMVTQANTRSASPGHQIPSITVTFEILGMDQSESDVQSKSIQVFIGSDALRAHSADVLLSQNQMVLYSNDRDKLCVPFVRPEDDKVFKYICTTNILPEKTKLNATAAPFVSGDQKAKIASDDDMLEPEVGEFNIPEDGFEEPLSPLAGQLGSHKSTALSNPSESGGESERQRDASESELGAKDSTSSAPNSATGEGTRRESAPGIWGSWRQTPSANGGDSGQRDGPLSGYQPAARGSRNMKVLKPQKSGSSARTGAAYEPPPPPRNSGEQRRRSQPGGGGENGTTGTIRWESKRVLGTSNEPKAVQPSMRESRESRESRNAQNVPRTSNPVGGASAFSWMNPAGKAKAPAAVVE